MVAHVDVIAAREAAAPSPAVLAERVRAYRLVAGLSMAEAARQVGIAAGYYGEIERGRKTPSMRVARRLAQAFGCAVDDLLEGPSPLPDQAMLEARRELLWRLLEVSTRLDAGALRSLLDYAGYLGQARASARRERLVHDKAPVSVPLFPDAGAMAPRRGFEPRT